MFIKIGNDYINLNKITHIKYEGNDHIGYTLRLYHDYSYLKITLEEPECDVYRFGPFEVNEFKHILDILSGGQGC